MMVDGIWREEKCERWNLELSWEKRKSEKEDVTSSPLSSKVSSGERGLSANLGTQRTSSLFETC